MRFAAFDVEFNQGMTVILDFAFRKEVMVLYYSNRQGTGSDYGEASLFLKKPFGLT